MKYLLLAAMLSTPAWGDCVEFSGVTYCDTETTITIGEKVIPVSNPYDLLTAARKSEVRKIFWGTVYTYPEVVVELAKQLHLSEEELIELLKDEDEAWMALHRLPELYYNVTKQTGLDYQVELLFRTIVEDISNDIEKQLSDYYYITPA